MFSAEFPEVLMTHIEPNIVSINFFPYRLKFVKLKYYIANVFFRINQNRMT